MASARAEGSGLVDADDDAARERLGRRAARDQDRAPGVVDDARRHAAEQLPGEPPLPVAADGDRVGVEPPGLDLEQRGGRPGAERRRRVDLAAHVARGVLERRPRLLAEGAAPARPSARA